ncbi:hypothetical protein GGI13_005086 [Coemansia sp. RSA 455]|nr:hypothetical protein GGI13_005086 [Coemansia sp. RSA 455]
MRHNEGYDRSHRENIDSSYYDHIANQQGNDVVQPQEQVYEPQQAIYNQQQHPGFNLPQEHHSQQPINSGYEQGASYPNQQPLRQDFEHPPELEQNWNYDENQQNGRPDELQRGYDSGYDSTDGYGMDRGFNEVKQKIASPFMKVGEDGESRISKTSVAFAAAVAVGTAFAAKKGLDYYRAKDDEERDVQIGGGYNDAHSVYPSTDVPPYPGSSSAYPNNSGYYPSSEHYGSS